MGTLLLAVLSAAAACLIYGLLKVDAKIIVYRYSYKDKTACMQDNLILGNGINETVTVSCETGKNMEVVFTETGLVIGNYEKERMCAYSDKFGELIVVQDMAKTCTKRVFLNNNMIDDDVQEEYECELYKSSIRTALSREVEPLFQIEHAEYFFVNTMFFRNNKCYMNIDITTTDIKDDAEVSCETAKYLELFYVPVGFILGDYKNNNVGTTIYSEANDELIVIDGEEVKLCTRKVFEKRVLVKKELMEPVACHALLVDIDLSWKDRNGKIVTINKYF